MKIGELAHTTGLSTKAIRYYEEIGLLPTPERAANGYRVYGDDTVERIAFVKDAQATGLSLGEISEILELREQGKATCDHVAGLLASHLADIDARIGSLRQTRREMALLVERAETLNSAECTNPNRCQVIASRGRSA